MKGLSEFKPHGRTRRARIRRACDKFSIAEVARYLDVGIAHIWNLYHGNRPPSPTLKLAMIKASWWHPPKKRICRAWHGSEKDARILDVLLRDAGYRNLQHFCDLMIAGNPYILNRQEIRPTSDGDWIWSLCDKDGNVVSSTVITDG